EIGTRPIYFERNQGGREPLYIYLGALAMAVMGVDPLAMRVVSVVVGLGAVVAGWGLARLLFGPAVAIAASGWFAVNFWHLVLSRNSFRAVTLPLALTVAMIVFWIGFRHRARWAWPVGGALFGIAQYTYFADRAAPLIVILFVVYLALTQRSTLRAIGRGLAVFVVTAVMVFAPLGVYYAQHPHIVTSRFEQVASIGGEDARAPDSSIVNFVNALGMFSVRGDYLWGRNIQNKPVFDTLGALLFYLGLVVALWRWRQPAYALALIWAVVMIAPTALSTSAPHYLRAVGLLPIIFVFPALGLWFTLERVGAWWPSIPKLAATRVAVPALLGLWLLAAAADARYQYFTVWAPRPEVYYGFHSDMNAIGRWLNTLP
ncbi:MAG: glycosyltransferase family 39 protein, partial [Dehalococcoidia bacterium]|nr:glycosyltransferase family 39 protein [Dehalococcoidia bacterium]